MKSLFVVALLLLTNPFVYSQSYEEFYFRASEEYRKKNFLIADSLFSMAIAATSSPTQDVFYNRGLVRKALKDTCGYCGDMYTAYSFFSDPDGLKNYRRDCVLKADTTYYSASYKVVDGTSKRRFLEVKEWDYCTRRMEGRIVDLGKKYTLKETLYLPMLKIFKVSYFKSDAHARFYLEDSTKIYTRAPVNSPRQSRPLFIGGYEELAANQVRQSIFSWYPDLKQYYKKTIPVRVIVDGQGKILDLKSPIRRYLDEAQFEKIKALIKIILVNNYEYPKRKLFNKPITYEYFQYF